MSVRLLNRSLWDVRRFEVISAREGTLDQAAEDRGDEASVCRILWNLGLHPWRQTMEEFSAPPLDLHLANCDAALAIVACP
jgi:hypothetical protein